MVTKISEREKVSHFFGKRVGHKKSSEERGEEEEEKEGGGEEEEEEEERGEKIRVIKKRIIEKEPGPRASLGPTKEGEESRQMTKKDKER